MNYLNSATQLPLHDIVDDHHVSWWPLAIGWWVLLAATLLGLVLVCLWWRRARKLRRQKQSIEALLHAPAHSISELNLRLKQVLLLKYPRGQFAQLNAQAWQQRLAAELPESQREAFLAQLAPFIELQYQTHDQSVVNAYQTIATNWCASVRPQFVRGLRNV